MWAHTPTRLWKGFGVIVGALFGIVGVGGPKNGVAALRDTIDFAFADTPWEAASWLTVSGMEWLRYLFLLAAAGILVWSFWPARRPDVTGGPASVPEGKYIFGGHAEDEPGVTIGPMPTAEALNVFGDAQSDYVPIEDAGRWLYANASERLRQWIKEMASSLNTTIADQGASYYRTSWQEGRCDLYGRWEAELPMEKIDPKDGDFSAFAAVFGSGKRTILDQSILRRDLRPVLDFYETAAATSLGGEPIKVRRDTPLREALMFAVTGAWGGDPWADGEGQLSAIAKAIERTRQLAADGAITVWGKANRHTVWQEIDPKYWVSHYIDLLDVLRSETPTKAYNTRSNEPLFVDLMVSRAEFESEWSDA